MSFSSASTEVDEDPEFLLGDESPFVVVPPPHGPTEPLPIDLGPYISLRETSARRSATLRLMAPFTDPDICEACYHGWFSLPPSGSKPYGPKNKYKRRHRWSAPTIEKSTFQTLAKAWRKTIRGLPPIPRITFDISSPGRGIDVRQGRDSLSRLIVTIASVSKFRSFGLGETKFSLTQNFRAAMSKNERRDTRRYLEVMTVPKGCSRGVKGVCKDFTMEYTKGYSKLKGVEGHKRLTEAKCLCLK